MVTKLLNIIVFFINLTKFIISLGHLFFIPFAAVNQFAFMNFLAHIYLSGSNDLIRIGGFIADSVKGNKYEIYPKEMQKGIILHREIDWFTDNDAQVRISKKRLGDIYGHYRGVIIDIFYDHFLAKNWSNYSTIELPTYANSFYNLLQIHKSTLPERVQHLMPYMIQGDWLSSYATLSGIEAVLKGMDRRTKGKSKMHLAIQDLESHYEDFEKDFSIFFKKLRNFSDLKLKELSNQ